MFQMFNHLIIFYCDYYYFYLSISALKNIRYSLCSLSSSLKDLLLMMLDFQDYWQVRIEIIIVIFIFIDIYHKTYSKCVSISPSKIVWYSKCPHVMQGLSFSSFFFLEQDNFDLLLISLMTWFFLLKQTRKFNHFVLEMLESQASHDGSLPQ